jgi:hypothetical protein
VKLLSRRKRVSAPAVAVTPSATYDTIPIAECVWREPARVVGRVRSIRVHPWAGKVATLECVVVDETGGMQLIFLGRRNVGGIKLGARVFAEGTVVERHGHLALLNPVYELLAS